MRKQTLALPVLVSVLTLGGCASSGKSTLMGAGLGAGLGAGIGAIVDPGPKGEGRIRNVFIGAAAGSLVGAGTGYLAHGAIEGREKTAYENGKKDGKKTPSDYVVGAAGEPTLLPPRVEARFVDEQVRGNIFVPAHFEYVIVEPARWSK